MRSAFLDFSLSDPQGHPQHACGLFSCQVPVADSTDCDGSNLLVVPDVQTARDTIAGKRGQTPVGAPPVVERLGIDAQEWSRMVKDFGRTFKNVAGKPTSIEQARSLKSRRRFYISRV